jgi:hypothetical protein
MVTDGIIASHLSAGALSSSTHASSAASGSRFEASYARAVARLHEASATQTERNAVSALLDPLLNLNSASTRLAEAGSGGIAEMKPSELMMLTMRSHEFLFNCQLVANVANRSSDGVQQLFRQQS